MSLYISRYVLYWDILENLCGIKSVIEYISVVHKLTSFLKTMMKDASFLQKTFLIRLIVLTKLKNMTIFLKITAKLLIWLYLCDPTFRAILYFHISISLYFHIFIIWVLFLLISLLSVYDLKQIEIDIRVYVWVKFYPREMEWRVM